MNYSLEHFRIFSKHGRKINIFGENLLKNIPIFKKRIIWSRWEEACSGKLTRRHDTIFELVFSSHNFGNFSCVPRKQDRLLVTQPVFRISTARKSRAAGCCVTTQQQSVQTQILRLFFRWILSYYVEPFTSAQSKLVMNFCRIYMLNFNWI